MHPQLQAALARSVLTDKLNRAADGQHPRDVVPRRRGARAAVAGALVVPFATVALAACGGPFQLPTSSTTTTASPASVAVRYAFSSGGAPTCTGDRTWQYTANTAPAGPGSAASQTHSSSAPVSSSGSQCLFTDAAYNLRPGTWTISLAVDGHAGPACKVALHGGGNVLNIATCQSN